MSRTFPRNHLLGICAAISVLLICAIGPAAPEPRHNVVVQNAAPAVGRIRVYGETGELVGEGSCFFVREDGVAATSFHVVRGGKTAQMSVPEYDHPFTAELVTAQPACDLAFIRIKNPPQGATFATLKLADSEVLAGDEVWALGYPSTGFSVTRGIVSGKHLWGDLPATVQRSQDISPKSHWLQTDCTINFGNSGGPLINSVGQVVGVNAMFLSGSNNAYFALSSRHVAAMLAAMPDEDMTFDRIPHGRPPNAKAAGTPGTSGAASPAGAGAGSISGAQGSGTSAAAPDSNQAVMEIDLRSVPTIAIAHDVRPAEVSDAAQAWAQVVEHKCPRCGGTGKETVSVQTGTRRNGNVVEPVYTNKRIVCSVCEGKGVVRGDIDSIMHALPRLTRALAGVDQKDIELMHDLKDGRDAISVVVGDAGVRTMLDQRMRRDLAGEVAPRQAVAGYGRLLHATSAAAKTGAIQFVRLDDTNTLIAISEPTDATAEAGDDVFFCALIAGTTETADSTPMVILQGGLVLTLPKTK